jgi:cytoskeletal protein CcmA (bactofilin family)
MNCPARVAVLVLCTLAAGAAADERVHRQGSDAFVAGESARVSEPVKGDLVAAGGELRIAAPVSGDLLAVGGMVRLEPAAAQDLYAAGGQVSFDGTLARNARIAGGSVSIGPKARIDGNASLAGGRVEMLGSVGGYLQAAGGRVFIDGRVDGNVEAAAGELELGPGARIAGRLRYRGGAPLKQASGAQVQGGIERLEMPVRRGAERFAMRAAFGLWTLGLMLMAAVLVAALPEFFGRVADAARTRLGWSLLAGFVALVAIPAAMLVLLVTLIGIPLAALAALGYLAFLLLGYVAAGIVLGDAALKRWLAGRAAQRGWRAGAAALGVLAIGLLALIPWLGLLVAFLALIAGMGALVLQLKGAPGGSAQ